MQTTTEFFIPDETAMLHFGAALATASTAPMIIFLHGDLGAGKTTFSRGYIRGLGHVGNVKSPTYTIVEPYVLEKVTVFHFDFYRVQDMQELEYIGIQDYFTPHSICLIEWPENAAGLLLNADLSCYIEPKMAGRTVKIVTHSILGMDVLKRLNYDK